MCRRVRVRRCRRVKNCEVWGWKEWEFGENERRDCRGSEKVVCNRCEKDMRIWGCNLIPSLFTNLPLIILENDIKTSLWKSRTRCSVSMERKDSIYVKTIKQIRFLDLNYQILDISMYKKSFLTTTTNHPQHA